MQLVRAALVGILGIAAYGQQPNSTSAALLVAGVEGPPWPYTVSLAQGSATIEIRGQPALPYLVAVAEAGVLTAGLPTPFGQLDLDLSFGFRFVVDGINCPCPSLNSSITTGPAGAQVWVLPFTHAPPQHFGGLQALVADPASPAGFLLSGAVDLTTTPAVTAIHVSSSLGAPANPGTASAPLPSLTAGIAASVAAGHPRPPVLVHVGTYFESPVFADGVSVHGGCDAASWVPGPQAVSVVTTGASGALASSITTPTAITGIEFRAADAPAPSAPSTALRIFASSDRLVFYYCRFLAGRGADGAAGQAGAAGTAGANGQYGCPFNSVACGIFWWSGALSGLGGAGAAPGGRGGDGGQQSTFQLWNGNAGETAPNGGGAGGAGGIYFWPSGGAQAPGAGAAGQPGINGDHGDPGSPVGYVNNATWNAGVPATAGNPGANGRGGGGGGGSSIYGTLNGHCGGGGGAGGSGGAGGQGGANGGASIAVLVDGSSPGFIGCTLIAGRGGDGGAGGAGGPSGAGGSSGSPPASPVPHGNSGGSGGAGGSGGGGAGGAGGPSFALLNANGASPAHLASSVLLPGNGGPGGTGGGSAGSSAPQGPPGPAQAIGP